MDLYRILAVERDATPRQVKEAYRKRAKQTHPDVLGGSAAAFDAVQEAWRVLGDPELRKAYDATGEIPERKPSADSQHGLMLQHLVAAFDTAIQQAEALQLDIAHHDLTSPMKHLLKERIKERVVNLDRGRVTRRRILMLIGRFRRKDGAPSFFDAMLSQRLLTLEGHIASEEANLAAMRQAEAVLGEYTYKLDELVQVLRVTSAASGATTATWTG